MTSSPAPDLDELERLAKAATPGPWRASGPTVWRPTGDGTPTDFTGVAIGWMREADVLEPSGNPEADAAYIVALVNAAPALLTELRAAREAAAESGRLREALRELDVYLSIALDNVVGPDWNRMATDAVLRARALLATPPAPSDHGAALDVERLAAAMQGVEHASALHFGGRRAEWGQVDGPWRKAALDEAERIAAEYARLAAPSVPPEETR